jgi:hypothetical protein
MKIEDFHKLIEKNKEEYKDVFEYGYSHKFEFEFINETIEDNKKVSIFKFDGELYGDYSWGDSWGVYYNGGYKPWKVEPSYREEVIKITEYKRI